MINCVIVGQCIKGNLSQVRQKEKSCFMKYTCKVLDRNLGKKNRPLPYKGIFQYYLTSFDTSDSLVPQRKLFLWLQMILSETRMWTAKARSHVYKSSPLGLSGYLSYRRFETLSSKSGQPCTQGCHSVLFFVGRAKLENIRQEVSVLMSGPWDTVVDR